MLTVISPAKTLDFETKACTHVHTQPMFPAEAEQLIRKLRTLSRKKLGELMHISPALAQLNYERYLEWEPEFAPGVAKQAVLAFQGDVYQGMEAEGFSEEDFAFAQDHLRILSGLYGILRPLDLIRPYRLEMGTKLPVRRKKDLYGFWGSRITDKVNAALADHEEKVLVNLASQEYFRVLDPEAIQARVLTPVFLDWKNGEYKMISFFAKKARGMMTAYIIQNRISKADDIRDFAGGGYSFSPERSSEWEWVFTRREE